MTVNTGKASKVTTPVRNPNVAGGGLFLRSLRTSYYIYIHRGSDNGAQDPRRCV